VLATSIKAVRDKPSFTLIQGAVSLGYTGHHQNLANGPRPPASPRMPVLLAFDSASKASHHPGSCSRRFVPGNQCDQPAINFYYHHSFPIPKRDLANARALWEDSAGCHRRHTLEFSVPNGPENRRREVVQFDGGRGVASTSRSELHRVRHRR